MSPGAEITGRVVAAEGAALPDKSTVVVAFSTDAQTLEPAGEISGVGGNGCVVDPKSGHGFTSDHPQVSMFDTKTLKLIKTIDVGAAQPDGIYFDPFNQRVYVFSHPTKDATVIDAKDGAVIGTIERQPVEVVGHARQLRLAVGMRVHHRAELGTPRQRVHRLGLDRLGRLCLADDHPDLLLVPEWHDGAHANARPMRVGVSYFVREISEERKREGDFDEHIGR